MTAQMGNTHRSIARADRGAGLFELLLIFPVLLVGLTMAWPQITAIYWENATERAMTGAVAGLAVHQPMVTEVTQGASVVPTDSASVFRELKQIAEGLNFSLPPTSDYVACATMSDAGTGAVYSLQVAAGGGNCPADLEAALSAPIAKRAAGYGTSPWGRYFIAAGFVHKTTLEVADETTILAAFPTEKFNSNQIAARYAAHNTANGGGDGTQGTGPGGTVVPGGTTGENTGGPQNNGCPENTGGPENTGEGENTFCETSGHAACSGPFDCGSIANAGDAICITTCPGLDPVCANVFNCVTDPVDPRCAPTSTFCSVVMPGSSLCTGTGAVNCGPTSTLPDAVAACAHCAGSPSDSVCSRVFANLLAQIPGTWTPGAGGMFVNPFNPNHVFNELSNSIIDSSTGETYMWEPALGSFRNGVGQILNLEP